MSRVAFHSGCAPSPHRQQGGKMPFIRIALWIVLLVSAMFRVTTLPAPITARLY
jgi:hypothetical protein